MSDTRQPRPKPDARTHAIVSRDAWLQARRALLAKEKAHMRQGDALAAERRALPWVRVEKEYTFDTEHGRKSLAELFDGKTQMIVHHLMFDPAWDAACPGCSFQAEHADRPAPHLAQHDVRLIAVSRAPLDRILAYRARFGWTFDWVSSFGSDFNYDMQVSFTDDEVASGKVDYNFGTITVDPRYITRELPGISVFFRGDDGAVYLTYATYARGLDAVITSNHYLDMTPEGRNDAAYPDWARRRDEY